MPKLEKSTGKGWHKESERHSRARKYGSAGGPYRDTSNPVERHNPNNKVLEVVPSPTANEGIPGWIPTARGGKQTQLAVRVEELNFDLPVRFYEPKPAKVGKHKWENVHPVVPPLIMKSKEHGKTVVYQEYLKGSIISAKTKEKLADPRLYYKEHGLSGRGRRFALGKEPDTLIDAEDIEFFQKENGKEVPAKKHKVTMKKSEKTFIKHTVPNDRLDEFIFDTYRLVELTQDDPEHALRYIELAQYLDKNEQAAVAPIVDTRSPYVRQFAFITPVWGDYELNPDGTWGFNPDAPKVSLVARIAKKRAVVANPMPIFEAKIRPEEEKEIEEFLA